LYKTIGKRNFPPGLYGPRSTIGLQFSPKSDRLALDYHPAQNVAKIWDISSGTLVAQLPEDKTYYFDQAVFSRDGSKFYTRDTGGILRVWSLRTGHFWSPPNPAIYSNIALSQDGTLLAVGVQEQNIALWNTQTQKHVLELSWASSKYQDVDDLIFNPDGSQLLVATKDATCCAKPQGNAAVILFDTRTGKQMARIDATPTTGSSP
jgi:WD40 repeat protein